MAPDHRRSQPSEAPPTLLARGNSLIGGLRALSLLLPIAAGTVFNREWSSRLFVRQPHARATLCELFANSTAACPSARAEARAGPWAGSCGSPRDGARTPDG